MDFSGGRTCSVCGSRITDGNPDGIGVECRASYSKARSIVFFDVKERAFEFYGIKASLVMPLFIETFGSVKFRSSFKKSFYPSIVEQWEEKGFISKKQLEICESWLYYKVHYSHLQEIEDETNKMKKLLIEQWKPNKEEQEKITNLANKFRHEFRDAS